METKKVSWVTLMTSGIIGFLVGFALLFLTWISQLAMVMLFAAYAIVLGITQMLAASGETESNTGANYLTVLGLYSVFAGILLMFFVGAEVSTIITLIGAYIIITGIAELVAALLYRSDTSGYTWLAGGGVFRALFGLFLLLNTTVSLSTFIMYIAVYAIAEGIVTGILSYEVKEEKGRYHRPQVQ